MAKPLIKYAIVSNRSDFWGDQFDKLSDAQECLVRHGEAGFHIERWTFGENDDGTHYGPHKERIQIPRPSRLICACCGSTAIGRQWWNRDNGYGYCGECKASDDEAELRSMYGVRGYHFSIAGVLVS